MGDPARRVAVVGDGETLRTAVRASGATLTDRDGADAIVAVGERAVDETATAAAPALPVGTGRYAVAPPSVPAAIDQLVRGVARRVEHPRMAISVAGDHAGHALFDVTLVTSEPARISEYRVSFPGGRETSFRADGVVVATPLGSDGYAGAAGGPVLAPGTGFSVVPVSPFTTRTDRWVTPEAVELGVERDGESVSLVLDDDVRCEIEPHEPITVEVADRVELLSVPAARDAE